MLRKKIVIGQKQFISTRIPLSQNLVQYLLIANGQLIKFLPSNFSDMSDLTLNNVSLC